MEKIKITKKDFIELLKIAKKLSKKIESICKEAGLDFEKDIS